MPQDEPGASLAVEDARALAEGEMASTHAIWSVDLSTYTEVEHSQEDRIGGRCDHSFTYELHANATTVELGDGKHRLTLQVSGDQLTGVSRYIRIPESFTRRYSEMRSANESIAYVAVLAFNLLYAFVGVLVGSFLLLRQRRLLVSTSTKLGLFMGICAFLDRLNTAPLSWMNFDTASATSVHNAQLAVAALSEYCLHIFVLVAN